MNSNTFHNIANILSLLLAAATAALIASGCTTLPTGVFECSQSWISPTYTSVTIAVLQALKLGVNVVRDGIAGLIKRQPPVQ